MSNCKPEYLRGFSPSWGSTPSVPHWDEAVAMRALLVSGKPGPPFDTIPSQCASSESPVDCGLQAARQLVRSTTRGSGAKLLRRSQQ